MIFLYFMILIFSDHDCLLCIKKERFEIKIIKYAFFRLK